MTIASEPKQQAQHQDSAPEHADAGAHGQANAQFTNAGAIPPVATGAHGAAAPSASDRAFGHVTASGLNVRSSPAKADNNIVGALHHGDKVETVGRDGAWLKIQHPGGEAFVHGAFVHVDGVGPAAPHDAEAQHETQAPAKPAPEAAHASTTAPAAHDPAAPAAHAHAPAPAAHDPATPAPAPSHVVAPAAHDVVPAGHAPTHDAHTAPVATPTPVVPPAAHHEPPAPEAHHATPAAPIHDAVAQHHDAPKAAPTVDPAIIRAEYQMLLVYVENNLMTPSQAITQLIAVDKGLNNGHMSPTGAELLAAFPAAIAHRELARVQHNDAKPQPEHADAHAPPASKPTDAATSKGADHAASAPAKWTPPADANMTDEKLALMASELHNPSADKIMKDLAGVVTLAKKLNAHLINKEIHGEDRENLVAGIGVVRSEVDGLDGADPRLAAFKTAVNHKLESVAPYHAQVNIRTIETGAYTTCNVTSLAMSLETIGKNAGSYKTSKRATILAVAQKYRGDIGKAELASHGNSITWEALAGLRLPDFMELAAIANTLHKPDPSDSEIEAAAVHAGKTKTHLDFLVDIAGDFGAHAVAHTSSFGGHAHDLEKHADDQHAATDVLADMRNRAEANPNDEKLRKKYEDALAVQGPKIGKTSKIESELPLETYKAAVMRDVAPHLDAGAGVISGTYHHFTHAFRITNEYIMVQDPGQYHRSERKLLWEEARALQYFWNYIVIK